MCRILFYLSFIVIFFSCSQKHIPNFNNYQLKYLNGKPEYSNLNYWASHPWKKDGADNIPADIQNKSIDSVADVFLFILQLIQMKRCHGAGLQILIMRS